MQRFQEATTRSPAIQNVYSEFTAASCSGRLRGLILVAIAKCAFQIVLATVFVARAIRAEGPFVRFVNGGLHCAASASGLIAFRIGGFNASFYIP
jgi:hypothetical protein